MQVRSLSFRPDECAGSYIAGCEWKSREKLHHCMSWPVAFSLSLFFFFERMHASAMTHELWEQLGIRCSTIQRLVTESSNQPVAVLSQYTYPCPPSDMISLSLLRTGTFQLCFETKLPNSWCVQWIFGLHVNRSLYDLLTPFSMFKKCCRGPVK